MADSPAAGPKQAAQKLTVAEPREPGADGALLAREAVAGDLLVEEVSIDGICGVY